MVRYGGSLIAVLHEWENGEVSLSHGFEEPYVCVDIVWPSLEQAKADFRHSAAIYRCLNRRQRRQYFGDLAVDEQRRSSGFPPESAMDRKVRHALYDQLEERLERKPPPSPL
jgi:hypothetical protein